jgi:hypothetical protein
MCPHPHLGTSEASKLRARARSTSKASKQVVPAELPMQTAVTLPLTCCTGC